jgi:adenosine deaminase
VIDARVENGILALCKDLLLDNVVYAEFRTGLKDLGSGLEGYLTAVLRGIQRGTDGTSLRAGLILSLRRDTEYSIAEQTIDLALKYRDKGVIGIDLSGDSTQGDGKHIFPALIRAKANHLPITLHIGESEKETAEQQMLELLTIQPQRIGHGVHLCEEGKKWVKEKKILVELCLTSAVKAKMIHDAKEHPALKLLLQGHPVAICTDDPLVFNTTLSQEYTHVAILTGLLPEEIQELQKQTQIYNFLH